MRYTLVYHMCNLRWVGCVVEATENDNVFFAIVLIAWWADGNHILYSVQCDARRRRIPRICNRTQVRHLLGALDSRRRNMRLADFTR